MQTNPYALIDESQRPLIRITFTGNKSTDENFSQYLNETQACYRGEEKIALLFDATHATLPALKHQQMQANWLKVHKKLMQNSCLGTAYLIPSPAIRIVLRMIFSMQKQPVPFRIFAEESSAMDWVKSLGSD
jgi:hypothetical protein